MEIGTVISKENNLYIVTEIIDGEITKKELLKDYIAKNFIIPYNGEHRTIKEIIEIQCDIYLSNHKVIEM